MIFAFFCHLTSGLSLHELFQSLLSSLYLFLVLQINHNSILIQRVILLTEAAQGSIFRMIGPLL
jgi:hypothetical protein